MIRTAFCSTALAVLLATTLAAQAPAPTPKPAEVEKALLGKWEGPYTSDQTPPGNLRLFIAKEEGAWKVTLQVISDQELPAGDVKEFKVVGTTISWEQEISGLICRASAELVSGALKGGSTCEGGGMALTASWVLIKV
jgi:hypothetical protein